MWGWLNDPFFGFPGFGSAWRAQRRLINLMNQLALQEEEEEQNEEPKDKDKKSVRKFTKSSECRMISQDGEEMEEHRERSVDSTTGKTLESTTRRIGKQWVRIDEETDAEGQKKTKETWHDVAEHEIADFKKKWEEKRGKFGFDHLALEGPKETK